MKQGIIRFAAIACCGLCLTALAENSQTNTAFEVTLTDGTMLVVELNHSVLPFKTSFAEVELPVESIATVEFKHDKEIDEVNLLNKDRLQGTCLLESLQVSSILGSLEIPLGVVTSIGRPKPPEPVFNDSPQARAQCINNLRIIDSAKEQWAMETSAHNGAEPNMHGVLQYIRGNMLPACPAGGTYKVNKIGSDPECNVPGHGL